MEETSNTLDHIHYLVAGRLLWDPHFISYLQENPKAALSDTLVKAGLEPRDELIKELVGEYEENKDKVLALANSWFEGGGVKPMVA